MSGVPAAEVGTADGVSQSNLRRMLGCRKPAGSPAGMDAANWRGEGAGDAETDGAERVRDDGVKGVSSRAVITRRCTILVLSRKAGQKIIIGEGDHEIVVQVVEIGKNKAVRIGVEAAKEIPVMRSEVLEKRKKDGSVRT